MLAAAAADDLPEADPAALAELAAAVGARRAAAIASALTGVPRNRLYRRITGTAGRIPTTMAFSITTPIYYVNSIPHLGHAYTTTAGTCSRAITASAARTSSS